MYVCVCMCVSSLLYLVRVVPFSVPLTFRPGPSPFNGDIRLVDAYADDRKNDRE